MAACCRAARPCAPGPLSRDCRYRSERLLHHMLAHVRDLEAFIAEQLSRSQCSSDGPPQPRKVELQARCCAAGRIAHRHDPASSRFGLHPSCAQVSKHTSYWCYHCRSKSMCARIGLHPSCASKRANLCVRTHAHTRTHTQQHTHTCSWSDAAPPRSRVYCPSTFAAHGSNSPLTLLNQVRGVSDTWGIPA